MNLFVGKEWRHRHREWTCRHSREGEDGENRQTSIDTDIPPCVKKIAGEKLLGNRKPSLAL